MTYPPSFGRSKSTRSAKPLLPVSCEIHTVAPSEDDVVQSVSCSKSSIVFVSTAASVTMAVPLSNPASASARMTWLRRTPSVLQRPAHDPSDVVPLRRDEKPQNRQHRQHRSRHHELGVLHVLAEQVRERHGQRVLVVVG